MRIHNIILWILLISDDIYYNVIVKSPNNITGINTEGNGAIAKPKTVIIGTSI
jgi:hypothetical protein